MDRETSITAQALSKSVIESTPRADWPTAIVDAVAVYRTAVEQLAAGSGPGGHPVPAAAVHSNGSPAPVPASQPPAASGAVPGGGGSLYTVAAVSPKNTERNARLCLVDPGGAEAWVGFRGADARLACSLSKGDEVTAYIERSGDWLNGSNLQRHGVPF